MRKHKFLSLVLCFVVALPLFAQQQTINVGTNPNDGTGDTLRSAFQKTNSNFTDLYTNKQPLDADLTAIAALNPSNDDVLQRKAGVWTHRTVSQMATDLRTPLDAVYQALDGDLNTIAGLTATNDNFLQVKSGAWTGRTVAQVATDLQTPFDSRYAPLSHTQALSTLTQSGATTGQVPAWNGSAWAPAAVTPDVATTNTYYAANYGLAPGNSGAANTAALQDLVDDVSAAGGGMIQLDFGTYNLAYAGTSPYAAFSANRYCIQMKTGVYIRGQGRVNGTKIRLADSQMAGTTNGVHLFEVGDGVDGFGLLDLELDGNAGGQSGWTGGYSQGSNYSTAISSEPADIGVPNIFNAYYQNLYVHDFYSCAMDTAECQNGVAINVRVDDCGEGFQIVRGIKFFCTGYQFANTNTVCVGDGWESSGGSDVSLTDFVIEGCNGGSGIDMATRNFRLSNGVLRDCANGGVVIQNDSATSAKGSPVGICSSVYVEDCDGIGISVSGGDDDAGMDVSVIGCRATRCTRGFLVHKASDAAYSKGICYLIGCHAEDCDEQGADITLCSCVVSGGSFNNNGDNGIILRPATNTARDETKYYISGAMCLNNTGFGVTCETASNVPRLHVSAYCEGNAQALTYSDKYAQISIPFPSATDIFVQNLRPTQVAAWNSTGAIRVSGERMVRIAAGPLGEINNGHNGQIVTLFSDTNPITIYDKTTTEGSAYYGNGPCNLNCFDAQNTVIQVGESVTFLYRASTGEWYQLDHSAGRDTLSLSPAVLPDNGVLLTANPPGSAATTAWTYDSTGDRAQLSSSMRNVRAGGTVYDRKWTNAGDAFTSATDGTSTFAWGLDNSASAWKLSASAALGTSDILSFTATSATVSDAVNIVVGSTTGTKIGTATTQKLGFYNATPIVQPASADQAAVTLGNANSEIGGLTISAAYDQTEVQALRDKCEELADDVRALELLIEAQRQSLVELGLIKGSN